MKKTNKFLKKLAVITLSSVAALQNICANTEINIDQNTITVNFDASNPQKATVNIRGVTRVVDGVKNGIFYLYKVTQSTFICCGPQPYSNYVFITNLCFDFGDGVQFWGDPQTGICYFTDNSVGILPLVQTGQAGRSPCRYVFPRFYGAVYTVDYSTEAGFSNPERLTPNGVRLTMTDRVLSSNPASVISGSVMHHSFQQIQPTMELAQENPTDKDSSCKPPKPPKTENPKKTSGCKSKKTTRWPESYMPPKNWENVDHWLAPCGGCDRLDKTSEPYNGNQKYSPHLAYQKQGGGWIYWCGKCFGKKTPEDMGDMCRKLTEGKVFYYCGECEKIIRTRDLTATQTPAGEIKVTCINCSRNDTKDGEIK